MKYFYSFLLIFFTIQSFSQKVGKARIDSLLIQIAKNPNDSLKTRAIKFVTDEYFFTDVDKALEYSYKGLALAKKLKWNRAISNFYASIGRAFSDKSNYDSSMFYYKKGFDINKKEDDKYNMASTLNNMGTAEQNLKSDYPKAIKFYFEALKYSEAIDNKYIMAVSYDNIGVIYNYQKNYPKALEYTFKGLKTRQLATKEPDKYLTTNLEREIGNSYTSIADIYLNQKDYLNAKKYLEMAIPIHLKIGNDLFLAQSYANMPILLGNNFQKKIEYGLKAKKLWDEISPNNLLAISNLANLGVSLLESLQNDSLGNVNLGEGIPQSRNGRINLAENYLKTAIDLSEKNGEISYKSNYLGRLAELQALKGDYKNAYKNFVIYQEAEDSLYSQKAKNDIAGLETKREVEIRDKEIQLKNLALETQKKQRIGYLVGLVLLATIGGLLFYQSQARKKTNITLQNLNTELDEANQIKAKFFAILSHDLRSPVANLINFLHLQKESPELLSPAIKQRNELKISESAENLLETMESMLLWSKSQMEHFEPKVKNLRVADLFDYLQKFFVDYENIQFEFSDKAHLQLVTDEDFLKTIMQNLTNNAVKALSKTDKPKILWTADQLNNQIILSITDNGPGIGEKQKELLFSESNSIGSKTGFGFHLIKDLAKAIGCKISLSPNLRHGTEFQIVFETKS
jgi:signal transduction histidine kinase